MDKKKHFSELLLKILVIFVAAIYVLYITNNMFNYIPMSSVFMEIVVYGMFYAPLVLALAMTLYLVRDKGIAVQILFTVLWCILIVLAFSPNLFGLL